MKTTRRNWTWYLNPWRYVLFALRKLFKFSGARCLNFIVQRIFGVKIISAIHAINKLEGWGKCRPIEIGKHCWLASNVTIFPGVHIGDYAIIGANAVVTHDIPPKAVAVGIPAKVVKYRALDL